MNMKKLVALLLALVMVFALCACGSKDNQDTDKKNDGKKTAMKADDIPDEMTSSDGKYQVAFVTDVGDLKDKSFNQGTYDGVKLYANANSKSYKDNGQTYSGYGLYVDDLVKCDDDRWRIQTLRLTYRLLDGKLRRTK